MTPAQLHKLHQRVDALDRKPMTPAETAMQAGLLVLHSTTTALCGGESQRVSWAYRVANNRANCADQMVLASLPADALKAAGKTASTYARLIHAIHSEF